MSQRAKIEESIKQKATEIRNQALASYIGLIASYRDKVRQFVRILNGIKDYMDGEKNGQKREEALKRIPDESLRKWLQKVNKTTFDQALNLLSKFATELEKTCSLFSKAVPYVKVIQEVNNTVQQYVDNKQQTSSLRAGRQQLKLGYHAMRATLATGLAVTSHFQTVPFVSNYIDLVIKVFFRAEKAINVVDKHAERIEKELDEITRLESRAGHPYAKRNIMTTMYDFIK